MNLKLLDVIMLTPGVSYGAGLPALWWSAPAMGKSAIIGSAIRSRYGIPCLAFAIGSIGEGGFGVVPVPVGKGTQMRLVFPPQAWVDFFDDTDGRGVVFFDELSLAPPPVQASLLGAILDRTLGSHRFPVGVRVVAAANPPAQAANGFELAPPLVSRLAHFVWEAPSDAAHDEYLTAKTFAYKSDPNVGVYDPRKLDAFEKRVAANWSTARAVQSARVTGFLSAHSTRRHRDFEIGKDDCTKAHPTRRGWDMTLDAITTAHALGYNNLDDVIVEACVGASCASEFAHYCATADLPDPAAVLDGVIDFTHNPSRQDRTAVALRAMANCVRATLADAKDTQLAVKRADRLWQLLDTIGKTATDLTLAPAQTLVRLDLRKGVNATRAAETLKDVIDVLATIGDAR